VHNQIVGNRFAVEDFGVVAIGRNEGERLVRCLTSIMRVSPNIVYVDSGSTDGSAVAAEEIGARVVALDLTQPFTAARARNEGFEVLRTLFPKARFVQFIDGDCVLVDGWLEKAHDFMTHRNNIAIVCGRRRELFPNASIYNQICDLEWNTPVGEATSCGGDSFVRVDAFEAAGGFRSQLIAGEEPELCVRLRKIGWKIWRLDADMTHHDAAMARIGQYWTRAVRSGYAFAEVSGLHKTFAEGIWRWEMKRAIFWGGFLPLLISICAIIITPAALACALAYPLQIIRIACKRGALLPESWYYAFLMTVCKFAEFEGILKFYWHQLGGRSTGLIEYK
jgi:glycosyltransferase involved in cell wall biosynthesis